MLQAKEVKGLAERLQRAEALVAAGAVHEVAGLAGYYTVVNGDGTQHYLVHLKEDGEACCSCRDYQDRQSKVGQACKHIFGAELFAAAPKAASEPKAPKQSKKETVEPQAEARPVVDGAVALARLQGDDEADPWKTAA